MAMQKDLLIGGKFEHEINDLLWDIDVEHRKHEMLEISQGVPANVAIIECIRRCHRDSFRSTLLVIKFPLPFLTERRYCLAHVLAGERDQAQVCISAGNVSCSVRMQGSKKLFRAP